MQHIGRPLIGWVLLWCVLWLPPLGTWLKQSMVGHMLVQISLLIAIGFMLGQSLMRQGCVSLPALKPYRWALLAMVMSTMLVWMIPRLLDVAVVHLGVDALKAVTLTFIAGLSLSLVWSLIGPVVKGLLHIEALATVLRLGWLYIDSPVRLCSQYRLDDQVRLGQILLGIGAVYAVVLAVWALMGKPLKRDSF